MAAAVAMAMAMASCGTKTPGNAADGDSTVYVDSTAEAGEAGSAALSKDTEAKVENVTEQLLKAVEAKDSKAAAAALTAVQTTYKNLVAEGKLEEAKAYGQNIQQFVSQNAESIKAVAGGDVTLKQLVEGVKNLPTSASTTAEQAAAAVKNAPAAVKEAASNAVNNAVDGAKEAAGNAVNNAKNAAKAKAEEKVNEAKKKANDAVNDAASKAIKGLLN